MIKNGWFPPTFKFTRTLECCLGGTRALRVQVTVWNVGWAQFCAYLCVIILISRLCLVLTVDIGKLTPSESHLAQFLPMLHVSINLPSITIGCSGDSEGDCKVSTSLVTSTSVSAWIKQWCSHGCSALDTAAQTCQTKILLLSYRINHMLFVSDWKKDFTYQIWLHGE